MPETCSHGTVADCRAITRFLITKTVARPTMIRGGYTAPDIRLAFVPRMDRPLIITMPGAEIGEPHQTAAEQQCKEGTEGKRYKSVDTYVYVLDGEPHLPDTPQGTCKKAEKYDDEQDHVTHCLSPGRIGHFVADIFHMVNQAGDYSRLTWSSRYFLPRLRVAKFSNHYI